MSRLSSNYLERSAVAVTLFLLFAPKINLIEFGGSGLRIDDLLLLVFSLIWLPTLRSLSVPRQFKFIILFFIFGLLSSFIGALQGRVGLGESVLYWTRNLQYLNFFIVGIYAARLLDLRRTLIALTVFLVLLALLEQFGGISLPDRFVGSGRFSGNTGGPYELAVVCAFLCLYFVSCRSSLIYVIGALALLILTQSRITLAATVLVLIVFHGRRNLRLIPLGCAFLLLFGALLSESSVAERLGGLFSWESYDAVWDYSRSIPVFSDTFSYRSWAFEDMLDDAFASGGDVSAFIRFFRWTSLLGSLQSCGISCWLFGLGPSFGSAAVDGNLVRFLVEYGIVGSLFFYLGVWKVVSSTKSSWLREYFFVLLITAVAIDIFVAYKAMALLWFACGYVLKRRDITLQVTGDVTAPQRTT